MSESILSYKAQEFFPPQCVECPTLVGLIEDGLLLGDDISREQVAKILNDSQMTDIETCPGPTEEPAYDEYGVGLICTKWLLEELTRK